MADRDASSGDYRYYLHDHLGSSRALYDGSKDELNRPMPPRLSTNMPSMPMAGWSRINRAPAG